MRDYKNYQADQIISPSAKGGGAGMLVGLLVGVVLGLVVALGIAVWTNQDAIPFWRRSTPQTSGAVIVPSIVTSSAPLPNTGGGAVSASQIVATTSGAGVVESSVKTASGGGSTTVDRGLTEATSGQEAAEKIDTSGGGAPARYDFYDLLQGKEKSGNPPTSGSKPRSIDKIYLQVGAFQHAEDADNLKARLALMGMEAVVQTQLNSDKTAMHRVRIGPFTSATDLQKQRKELSEVGFGTTVVKVPVSDTKAVPN